MRTMILCLNGIGSPERVRYSSSKTQVLKGNLFSQLSKVLSGTSDLFSIDKQCKDYFAPYFRGRRTIEKQFLVFLHELLSIKNHPLPSSGSLEDLYKIYLRNEDFTKQLKKLYRSSEVIIINDQFWVYVYNKAANSKSLEVENFLNLLGVLCKDRNAYIWENFSDKNIWNKVFIATSKITDSVLFDLDQWLKFLGANSLFPKTATRLLENIPEVRPFQKEIKHLLYRILPSIKKENSTILIDFVLWFNSGYFNTPAQVSVTVHFLHLLINLFIAKSASVAGIIESFFEVRNHFSELLLKETCLENINFLKRIIVRFLPVAKQDTPNLVNISKNTLVTFYISSRYHDHMIRSIDEVEEKLKELQMSNYEHDQKCFHETFFSTLFIKYETPWYFIRNLQNMNDKQFYILFELLKGKNLRAIFNPAFPVTKKEFHLFQNFSKNEAYECQSFINTGLLWAKFKNIGFCDRLRGSIKRYIEQRVTIDQFIDNYDFYMGVLDYFKKHEANIEPEQVVPILDYIINQYEQEVVGRLTFKEISINRLLREIEFWHRSLNTIRYWSFEEMKKVKWRGLSLGNMDIEFETKKYSIIQIKSLADLLTEGMEMHHCVFSYHMQCINGTCSIWSLRIITADGLKRLATIEVIGKQIVQVRKKANRLPERLEMLIINEWSNLTGLHACYLN